MPECPVCGNEEHKTNDDFWRCEHEALVDLIEEHNQEVFEEAVEEVQSELRSEGD